MMILIGMVGGIASAADKVIEWKFDGNLSDSSGNGLNANFYSNPSAPSPIEYGLGVSGQALVSDGNECAYLTDISTSVLPVLADDEWSVNLWVYPTEMPRDWRVLWCLGQKPTAGLNSRAVYSSGYIGQDSSVVGVGKITFVGRTTSSTVYTVSSIPWDINQWQMITTTYDGTIVRIYKNGVLIAMRNQTFLDAPGEVRVPSNPWNGYDFFIGRFDEFTVWRGQLSQQEILGLIIPGVIPDVELNQQVVYYKMGDPTSTTMPDHSGQDNDGTLYGYTLPIENWIAEGFREDSLLFDGGQAIYQSVTVSQPVNYTVTFWLKSGQQSYQTAFYSEKQIDNVPGFPENTTKGTQLIIRANNDQIQVFSKERDYNTLFSFAADASAYLDGVTWNHLALVADGEAAQVSLYMNGELLASEDYLRSSHKTTGLDGSVGRSLADFHYIGEWGPTYVDEVKIWNGALTPEQIKAVAAHSNFGNDLQVDMEDAAFMAEGWLLDYVLSSGSVLVADDMEGSLDRWSVYSGSYSGTGTITPTANAYAGSGALRWDYELPATTDPNNYTSIVFDFGEVKDLSIYDEVSLWLYRHGGNSPEDILFVKFLDDSMQVVAEDWILGDGAVTDPNEQWGQWLIDPNSLLGPYGAGTADESDLDAIRYILIGTGSWDRTDARAGAIDIDELTFAEYPVCSGRPEADLNWDCKVDLQDLLYVVDEWLFGIE